jgi:hypothetical protein
MLPQRAVGWWKTVHRADLLTLEQSSERCYGVISNK